MSNALFRKLFIKHSTPVEKSIGGTPVVDENLQKIAGAVAARAAPIIGRAAKAGVKAVKPYVTQAGKAGLGAAAKAGKSALWSGAQAAKPHVAAALESAKAGKAAGGLGAAAKAAKPHLGTAGKVGLGTAGAEFGADMGARASKKIQENVPPPPSTNEPPPSTNGKPFYYSKLLNKKSFDTLFTKQNPELASQMAKRGLIFDKNRHRWIKKPESREQPSYGARSLGYTRTYDKTPGSIPWGSPGSEIKIGDKTHKFVESPSGIPKSESIKHNLDKYVDMITDLIAENWTRNEYTHAPAPTAKIHNVGERFARISIAEDGKSVSLHSWIDMKTGDIINGSWKAPTRTKKGLAIRGNILSDDLGRSKIDHHGPKYLR